MHEPRCAPAQSGDSRDSDGGGLSRRRALQGIASVGMLVLAGCSSVSLGGGVQPLWRQSLPEASATGPPAATNKHVLVGAQDKSLYAFGIKDGTQAFKVETGGPVETQPAVPTTGGPYHVHSTDGDLYTVGMEGERLWHEEGQSHQGRVARVGSLLVDLDLFTETIRGRDARSGAVRFERPGRVFPSPAVTDSVCVVPVVTETNQFRLVVFDPTDGTVRWRTPPAESVPHFAAEGDLVVTAGGPTVTARRGRDGAILWQTKLDVGAYSYFGRPIWFGQQIYIQTQRNDQPDRLLALSRSDGVVRWRQSAGYEIEGVAPTGEAVYVASSVDDPAGGILVRLDRFALDGTRQWQVLTTLQIGGTIEAISRVGQIVFVASEHAVAAFDPRRGNRRWYYEPDGQLHVTATDDGLYVSSRDRGGVARLPTG